MEFDLPPIPAGGMALIEIMDNQGAIVFVKALVSGADQGRDTVVEVSDPGEAIWQWNSRIAARDD